MARTNNLLALILPLPSLDPPPTPALAKSTAEASHLLCELEPPKDWEGRPLAGMAHAVSLEGDSGGLRLRVTGPVDHANGCRLPWARFASLLYKAAPPTVDRCAHRALVAQVQWAGCWCRRAAGSRWTSKARRWHGVKEGSHNPTLAAMTAPCTAAPHCSLCVPTCPSRPLPAHLSVPPPLPSVPLPLPGILYETEAVPLPCTLALVQTKNAGSELVRAGAAARSIGTVACMPLPCLNTPCE